MKEKDCILVVDDDEGTRKSLTLLLKRKGFETEHAETGKGALVIAESKLIHLTLLDIKLPDTDGIQLLAPLKKTNPDMVIIMITGFASVESAVQSLTAGASSYITKPINLEELFLKIKTALDHQHLVAGIRWTEEELKVSLAKYKVLFESLPIAITISDREGKIVESNSQANEILGLFPEEQSRRKIDGTEWQLIRPDGTPMPAEEYASVRALKENHLVDNIEMGIVRGTGPVTWINVTAAPIPLKDYGVAIAYSDITKRKKTEQKLIENELKFRELFDNMSAGVAIYEADAEGNDFFFKNLNRAGERIDSLKREDVIGKSLLAIFPAIKEFGLFDVLQRVWRTGIPESHPASLYQDARISGWRENFVYKLPSGEIATIYDDITERRRVEVALRDNEKFLSNIVEQIPDMIFVKDAQDLRFVRFNKAGEVLLGYSREELLGKNDYDLFPNGEADSFTGKDKEVLRNNRLIDIPEEKIQTRHKGERILHTKKIPIFDEKGDPSFLLGISEDITERKEAEEKLRYFNEELEQQVAERTEALNKSLQEKEILLKEVHHRVKNNMQIIFSLLNLQARTIDDPVILKKFKESQSRIRAMALVHERLYQSGNLMSIDLKNYIESLVKELYSFYGAKSQIIRFTINAPEVRVNIDTAIPLGLMINELISNAIKYAFPNDRKGEIVIDITEDKNTISLVVRDNGIGIPADFDWRNATSLGLRLIISLVEQLQGTIELDRTAGTMFKILVNEKQ